MLLKLQSIKINGVIKKKKFHAPDGNVDLELSPTSGGFGISECSGRVYLCADYCQVEALLLGCNAWRLGFSTALKG